LSGDDPAISGIGTEARDPGSADDRLVWKALLFLLIGFAVIAAVVVIPLLNPEKQQSASSLTSHPAIEYPAKHPLSALDKLPQILFRDITGESGFLFDHDNGARGEKLLPEIFGSGCAFFDYNNDDAPDILMINANPPSANELPAAETATMKLFENDGRGLFRDVTDEAGLKHALFGMGVAVGDFDNDGWSDVYVTAVGINRLFHNNRGVFEDVTEAAGVGGRPDDWSMCCCWFDLDNDGDLDLFVGNYVEWSAEIDRQLDCTLLSSKRSYCHPENFGGSFPRLFRNDGAGRFTEVSESAGIRIRNPDTQVPVAKCVSALSIDVNRDGWLDLVVANDGARNFLFLNQHDGTFDEAGARSGLAYNNKGKARRATGLDAGWFREGRSLGLVLGNVAIQPVFLYVAESGTTVFSENALVAGLSLPTRVPFLFNVMFLDADLDGRLDLLATNGHVEPDIDKLQQSQNYAQPPQLFWNSGGEVVEQFVPLPVEKCGEGFSRPIVGRGSAFADIDSDGDLDLLLSANGSPARLLRNEQDTGNHWLRLKLTGRQGGGSTTGARVELTTGDTTQIRQVRSNRGYLSQSESIVTFGLGGHSTVDLIRIRWADGATSELTDIAVDRLVSIQQESTAVRNP
jgi:hypothetical protein